MNIVNFVMGQEGPLLYLSQFVRGDLFSMTPIHKPSSSLEKSGTLASYVPTLLYVVVVDKNLFYQKSEKKM